MRNRFRRAFAAIAGAGFIFVALAAIGYQETIAPSLERLNERFDVAAATAKLTRFWA
jgi:hypothetical protein